MSRHVNKIALVTGSSRGLGRNMALSLARNGADVVVTYRSKKAEADAVVAEIQALGRKAVALEIDTGVTKSFAQFAETLKAALQVTWQRSTFDFLVNNAGIDLAKPFTEFTEEDFDQLLNVHFKGVFFLTQRLLPLIADNGRIVNLSTGLARFSLPGYSAYGSMKAAIDTLTRYLAKELGSRGIRVNSVAPGAIETDFNAHVFSIPGVKDHIAADTPLGRVGVPDDIGGVVNFVCSEDARWVNGQRIEVSGGIHL
ncbi:3-oxoacyl-[acyl-carrier-protein] reductase [Capsaspora owczarzaki ATCC 30864]|uniref:3-oxoacyl-[acyl-carrier-protein] reductase n=1 Tax=Capsaspora owczarzaki (strain ATCC 30864) TaxID=595528 RepID=A0A0D2WQ05_CAPO3|nr:3-oxoacyl-[acyl-carrier-protein] reductase [Capsaspora owczarzaki ATCC 30864]KJE92942.1 3-oxoacyl-[acyl-carrier-protein] reductase [Capsaspora owczarzaki ATCC 30864]KJE92943.1 3-oxoacyl-[acyl-carrier-protein] reductase, variant [Capsaspora owczarzaki ATCC 30864]|eukprot:XP_004363548.1 3-oxoacyl-[acyl-carrier-protein] reductase [Capsaspora owczarzaki ATCC 30864]